MSTIKDDDKFLIQRGIQSFKQNAVDLMSTIQDDDLMLVQRGEESFKVTCEDVKDQLGGGDNPAVITTPVTLTASSSFFPSTLTATKAVVTNGTEITSYPNWYKDDVAIDGATGLTYEATEAGTYKYKEEWVGGDSEKVYSEAEVSVIAKPAIATPSVITPAKGAGLGLTYYPWTSKVTNLTKEDSFVGYAWNVSDNFAPRLAGYAKGQYIEIALDLDSPYFVWKSVYSESGWQSDAVGQNEEYKSLAHHNGYFYIGYSKPGISYLIYALDDNPKPVWSTATSHGGGWYYEVSGDYFCVAYPKSKGRAWGCRPKNASPDTDFTRIQVSAGMEYVDPDKFRHLNGRLCMAGRASSTGSHVIQMSGTTDPMSVDHQCVVPEVVGNIRDMAHTGPADGSAGAWIVIDNASRIYRSFQNPPTGPENWSRVYTGFSPNGINGLWGEDGKLFACGPDGIYTSTDFGSSWIQYSDENTEPHGGYDLKKTWNGSFTMYQPGVVDGYHQKVYKLDMTSIFPPTKENVYTFDDDNVYPGAYPGTPTGQKLSDVFKEGDKTFLANTSDNTGTVVSVSGNIMRLSGATSDAPENMSIMLASQVPLDGPTTSDLVFTASIPLASSGTIATSEWGSAKWELSETNFDSPTNVKTTSVAITDPSVVQQCPATNFSGLGNREYYARVTYDADVADSAAGGTVAIESSPSAKDHNFKFEAPEGWFSGIATGYEIAWNNSSNPIFGYGGGKFVIYQPRRYNGVGPDLITSTDGLNWTAIEVPFFRDDDGTLSLQNWSYNQYTDEIYLLGTRNSSNLPVVAKCSINDLENGWSFVNHGITDLDTAKACAFRFNGDAILATTGKGYCFGNNFTTLYSTFGGGSMQGVAHSNYLDRWVCVNMSGQSWTQKGQQLQSDGMVENSSGTPNATNNLICVNPSNNQVVFVCTSTTQGYYSTDGQNWQTSGPFPTESIQYLAAKSGDASNNYASVIVGCGYNANPYISSVDGGRTWQSANATVLYPTALAYSPEADIFVGPRRNDFVYSYTGTGPSTSGYSYDTENLKEIGNYHVVMKYGISPYSDEVKQFGIAPLTEQPDYPVAGYELQADGRYRPIEDQQAEVRHLKAELVKSEIEKAALKQEIKEAEAKEEESE